MFAYTARAATESGEIFNFFVCDFFVFKQPGNHHPFEGASPESHTEVACGSNK